MIILPEFELIYNADKAIYIVVSKHDAAALCPECGQVLSYRDSRLRVCKTHGGKKSYLLIRRLKCCHCHRLHNELPDILAPYKHYETEVIEDVVDGVIDADDIETEAYPCETTMRRWREWVERNTYRIDGMLKSTGYRFLGFSEQLLKSSVSLLNELRRDGAGWLGIILRIIYNSGGFLPV